MIKQFLSLAFKKFKRSANMQKSIVLNILLVLFGLYMASVLIVSGTGMYFLLKKAVPNQDPMFLVNQYFVYWVVAELIMRYLMQKLPVMDVKPLMVLPVKKDKIIHFLLRKSVFSFFNLMAILLFVPFGVALMVSGYSVIYVLSWLVGVTLVVLVLNFTNFLVNKSPAFFFGVLGLLATIIGLRYFDIYDCTVIIGDAFYALYAKPYFLVVPLLLLVMLYRINFKILKDQFYLDAAVSKKVKEAKSSDLSWVDGFGELAPFLKNEIKLIWRNKRSKTFVFMSLLILLYGLIFFANPAYAEGGAMFAFVGLFMSGIFVVNYGQMIPAWDSSYYGMLMSQNIRIENYVKSKVLLLRVSVIVLTMLSVPYVYFGWNVFAFIAMGAIYNLGVNIPVIMAIGAYNRKGIDVNKGGMMNYEGMGVTQWLLVIPFLGMPVGIFALIEAMSSQYYAMITMVVLGILGLLLNKVMIRNIAGLYAKNKYATLAGFKESTKTI